MVLGLCTNDARASDGLILIEIILVKRWTLRAKKVNLLVGLVPKALEYPLRQENMMTDELNVDSNESAGTAPEPPAAPAPSYSAPQYSASQAAPVAAAGSGEKSKVVAGILGILLGSLGIHKFYLGYTKEGVIMACVAVLSIGFLAPVVSVIGLIEGIMYLMKSDEEFEQTYVIGQKPWL